MTEVDLHTVGEPLGHRTAQMIKRYAHLSVNHKQAAVERISGCASGIEIARDKMKTPGSSRKML
jgi:hypothetical protein